MRKSELQYRISMIPRCHVSKGHETLLIYRWCSSNRIHFSSDMESVGYRSHAIHRRHSFGYDLSIPQSVNACARTLYPVRDLVVVQEATFSIGAV